MSTSDTDVAAYWDREAATFDDEVDHGLRDPVARDAWRQLLGSVLPAPPGDVVDLGAGTGSLACLLAEDGWPVPRPARPRLWGGPVDDERYVAVARSA